MGFWKYPVGQTDRQTDRETDRQTHSSQYCTTTLAGKVNILQCMDIGSKVTSALMGLRLKKYIELRENCGPSADNCQ